MERARFVFLIGACTLIIALIQISMRAGLVDVLLYSSSLGVLFMGYGEWYDRANFGSEWQIGAKLIRAFGTVLLCGLIPAPWDIGAVAGMALVDTLRTRITMQKHGWSHSPSWPFWAGPSMLFSLLGAGALVRVVPYMDRPEQHDQLLPAVIFGASSFLFAFLSASPWRK